MKNYLGMDIGGTKCAVVLGDETGTVHSRAAFDTAQESGWQGVLARLAQEGKALLSGQQPSAVGISCGGPLNARTGIILSPPNLPGWDEVPVTAWFAKEFGVPAYLQNDANACALAEWKYGAGRGTQNCIFLTFGTGLGAGLILDGRLYDGASGMAGEVGHLRLAEDGPEGYHKNGSFEGFCSGGGLSRLAELRFGLQLSAKQLAEAANAGDVQAQAVFKESGSRLGQGLAFLVDILNPERIIIGSVYTRAEKLFFDSMNAVLRAEALPQSLAVCSVVPAALGESIGDIAALAVATQGPTVGST